MKNVLLYYNPDRPRAIGLLPPQDNNPWALWKRSLMEKEPFTGAARLLVADLRGVADQELWTLPITWHPETLSIALVEMGEDVSKYYEIGYTKVIGLAFDEPIPLSRIASEIQKLEQLPRYRYMKRALMRANREREFHWNDPRVQGAMLNPWVQGDRVVSIYGGFGQGLSSLAYHWTLRYETRRGFTNLGFVNRCEDLIGDQTPLKFCAGTVTYVACENPTQIAQLKQIANQYDIYLVIGTSAVITEITQIKLPDIKDRSKDLEAMANSFVHELSVGRTHGCQGITPQAMSVILGYTWPGGVRELHTVLERAFLTTDFEKNPHIDARHLRGFVQNRPLSVVEGNGSSSQSSVVKLPEQTDVLTHAQYKEKKKQLVEAFEKDFLTQMLNRTGGNVSEVARTMGMDRSNLLRLMRRHRISANIFRKAA